MGYCYGSDAVAPENGEDVAGRVHVSKNGVPVLRGEYIRARRAKREARESGVSRTSRLVFHVSVNPL
ncbi:hypothetical protein Y032_0053g2338 [Ancylostoma ceylanicum]|uniref:Uncharacterized protein n=1 Tax=Ancylostoma ceylanicum TaxID=53326 RepID=A0A016U7F2_9BILA|nr:hypothetical protein Y032_0053g2338 [Ancylostoma ceylanicum]